MSKSYRRATVTRLVAAALVATAFVLIGCGDDDDSDGNGSGGDVSASADNKIRVALVPAATADLPFQFAQQNGLFEEQGLDVTLKTPSIPFSQLPATLGKQFDVVIGSQPDLIKAGASGIDVVAISGLQKDNPEDPGAALVVPGDSPIKSIADLEGKTVGAPSIVGNNWTALQCWAQKEGVDPNSFRGLEAAVPQLPELLAQGRFDSILIFEPLLTPAVEEGNRNIGNAYEECFGGPEFTAMLLSQGAWAESHSEQIDKFLTALEDGKAAIAEDPQAARDIYIETSGLPPEAAERTPIIPEAFDFSQGQVLVDDVQTWADLLSDLGTFNGSVNPEELVAQPAGG
jgi:NitT/TauT family transport system substrate-binding protein